jgi:hypothetical protein
MAIGGGRVIRVTASGRVIKKRGMALFLHKINLDTTHFVSKEIIEHRHNHSHDERNDPKNYREYDD